MDPKRTQAAPFDNNDIVTEDPVKVNAAQP